MISWLGKSVCSGSARAVRRNTICAVSKLAVSAFTATSMLAAMNMARHRYRAPIVARLT